jgi:hypothetical protein
MAENQLSLGGQSTGSNWFHPVDGGSASVSGYSADGSEVGEETGCVDGVCPVPWAKPAKVSKSQIEISTACDEIKQLLLDKNKKYGDSALNPLRVFSTASTKEQLLVRIDDKLSRIQKGAGLVASDEDVIQDLIGYLVLLKIAIKLEGG